MRGERINAIFCLLKRLLVLVKIIGHATWKISDVSIMPVCTSELIMPIGQLTVIRHDSSSFLFICFS